MAKLTYEIVLTGRSLRKAVRAKKRKELKGELISPIGKMRSRQERKAMAKALKIPFQPRHNGPVFNVIRKLVTDKKGRLKVAIMDIKEVK
jgi:hypothetical protein